MQFRNQICLFLAFFLLVSNTGFSFNVHYCGEKIASVSLKSNFPNEKLEDECCGITEKKSNCCNNKIVHFHKNIEQVVVNAFSLQLDFCFLAQENQSVAFYFIPNFKSTSIPAYYCDAHAPPLFKLYSQYIFYDRF